MSMPFIYDDGGRRNAGYRGHAGDCVCRAITIASGRPYQEVYDALARGVKKERRTKHGGNSGKHSARNGIHVKRGWFKALMQSWGFVWTPTMQIGSGCKTHLAAGELPQGRLVVSVSKHYTAVIDGAVHDTHDPQREVHCIEPDRGQSIKTGQWRNSNGICSIQRRCVYGYWKLSD